MDNGGITKGSHAWEHAHANAKTHGTSAWHGNGSYRATSQVVVPDELQFAPVSLTGLQ